ncbi:MAG: PLP-dependent aminotransferase family protein [Clostridiales bacterium]|nr:PLP-dependent aminotransferase family protein [Clostridiales bacterium]MBS5877498.1 PLP-dependent aminotransferase family protein [Clostridiales bacterium]MDU0938884.1 PLP-dependent aminotransferase family protein [Clostridiales bacterium]MDU1041476.1 PLP-dependent aminotransferase family protein [Clostridiales bacterium]MDU3490306.1 PLP-dependent aminotransferase family protein [Clostridiales bacterium]
MITYDLEKRGNDPIYVYLYKRVRDDILSGVIEPNEKLPSKRAFANNLNVGVNTVANAYDQLVSEGYIYSSEKKGYYATDMRKFGDIHINTKAPEPIQEEEDPEYFMDFRANRINLKNFPISIWNRCMRKVALDGGDKLYKTVPYNGVPELRNAISSYLYKNRGMSVDPRRIIIGAGTEYLYRRLFELFKKGVTFGIEDTGFKKLAEHADKYNANAVVIRTDKEGMDIEELDATDATIAYVSPSNRFPTGRIMSIKKRLELFAWAYKDDGRFIVEDDYDSEFRYSGRMILPMYAEDTRDKVIYMNTFSKTMVPSLRISYMVLPERLVEKYKSGQGFYSCTVSSFEQYALAEFINCGAFDRHINRMRNYYKKKRVQILNEIARSELMKIASVEEHNVGTHFLLKVDTRKSHEEIYEEGIKRDLHISFFSDYSVKNVDETGTVTLVINYAAISGDKIGEVVKRLTEILVN